MVHERDVRFLKASSVRSSGAGRSCKKARETEVLAHLGGESHGVLPHERRSREDRDFSRKCSSGGAVDVTHGPYPYTGCR
jgi:hypothetical protein